MKNSQKVMKNKVKVKKNYGSDNDVDCVCHCLFLVPVGQPYGLRSHPETNPCCPDCGMKYTGIGVDTSNDETSENNEHAK